jgi:hypothetical protein
VDKAILERNHGLAGIPVASYKVPSKRSVLHRIICGRNGEMLFTELATNRFGKISIIPHHASASVSVSSNNYESPGPSTASTVTPLEEEQEPIRQDEISIIPHHGSTSVSSNNYESPAPPIASTGTPVEEEEEPIGQDEISIIPHHGSASVSSNNYESPGPPTASNDTPVEREQEPIRQDETQGETPSPSSSQLYKRSFEVKDIGKNRKPSKKQVTWVFEQEGSNPHSIVMVWSKRSGKVQIEMDSTQVLPEQALTTPRAQYVEHIWTATPTGLRMQILANRTTRSTMLGCSKYELRVNEMHFSEFPSLEIIDSAGEK